MKSFHVHPLALIVILPVLFMGMVGLFVVLPIVCLQWIWNVVVVNLSALPHISTWQSALLYLACAILFGLTGIIRIEIDARRIE